MRAPRLLSRGRQLPAVVDLCLETADEPIRDRRIEAARAERVAPLRVGQLRQPLAHPPHIVGRDAFGEQFLMPSVITEVDEAVVHAVDEARIGGGEDEGDEDRFFQSPVALFPIHVQPCGKKQSLQVRLEVRLTVRLAVRLAVRLTVRLAVRLTVRLTVRLVTRYEACSAHQATMMR